MKRQNVKHREKKNSEVKREIHKERERAAQSQQRE
jgi:hypothetical protein